MTRFFAVFLSVLMLLFGIEKLNAVHTAVVYPWTGLLAQASAFLMSMFDQDVISHGQMLQSQSTGFAVSIESGCNGVEAAIILVAGIIAFPAPLRLKVLGVVFGVAAVQVVNLLRIISLYYLGKWDTAVFEFAHLYLWQALIMLDVLVVWLLWMRAVARRSTETYAA